MTGKNFLPFSVLKTVRLTLRQLVTGDDKEIFALRSDENVNKYLGRKPAESMDDARNFILAVNENIRMNNSIYWAITLNGSDKLIGTICLFDFSINNLKAEIGYELLPAFGRKGIMQEAAAKVVDFGIKHIGLHSIVAYTHPDNHSSTRLLEKFNFQKQGVDGNNLMIFKLTANS